MTEERPPVPFREWMADALYGPNGYYSANIGTVGRLGDFSTSAGLSPVLARAIAHWIQLELAHWKAAESPLRCIVECGAGDGAMMARVAKELGWFSRKFGGLHFKIVETSPSLRAQQQKKLSGLKVTWHTEIAEALGEVGGEAIVYSNEFPDAFPATLLEKTKDGWGEIEVVEDRAGNYLREQLIPYEVDPALSSAFTTEGFEPADRIEVHPSFREWMGQFTTAASTASLLTIDYGDEIERIYRQRPRGTLRAYFKHQTFHGEAIYQRKGRQDLTADINFTDLVEWGDALGLETVKLEAQHQFIHSQLPKIASTKLPPASAAMLDPDSAGGAFQVLHQRIT